LEFADVDFCGGRKMGKPGENPRSKARTNNKLNPHMAVGQNQTQATLVGGECSHHCPIRSPLHSYITFPGISFTFSTGRQLVSKSHAKHYELNSFMRKLSCRWSNKEGKIHLTATQ